MTDEVMDAIHVIEADFPQFFKGPVTYRSVEQVKKDCPNASAKLIKALKRLFEFQKATAPREDCRREHVGADARKQRIKKLVAVYTKYSCSQKQAAVRTGIPVSTVGYMTIKVPEVRAAYESSHQKSGAGWRLKLRPVASMNAREKRDLKRDIQALIDDLESGKSQREIANDWGIDYSKVNYLAKHVPMVRQAYLAGRVVRRKKARRATWFSRGVIA